MPPPEESPIEAEAEAVGRSLGARIAAARKKAGLTVEQAARKVGCTPQAWGLIEADNWRDVRGIGCRGPCALWNIADALGVEPKKLLI
jgi:transcriptional regulator with XRE-family HTH domain